MSARIYIGTSGWNYAGWKDTFYAGAPRKKWLEYYASRFGALEVDGTFYRLLKPAVAESWFERTPNDFRFVVKGGRFITHSKRLMPEPKSVHLVRDSVANLDGKLAAILWQLPANFEKDLERLRHFAAMLDDWRDVRHVIEFRHESWFDDEVAALMEKEHLGICQSDAPDWPLWDAVMANLAFIRLHGHTTTYSSNYSRHSLEKWAASIRRWHRGGCDVHVYFDNDARGHAPENALSLAGMLGAQKETESVKDWNDADDSE